VKTIRSKSGKSECIVDGGGINGRLPNGEMVPLYPHSRWLFYVTDGASSRYPPPQTAKDYTAEGLKRLDQESEELAAAI
jgi:hypothetical protein